VKANAPAQTFSYEYFASHRLFPGGTFVVVMLALVHYVVAFGPLLAVLAWQWHRRPVTGERLHLALVGAGILGIFCIAFDWARHANLIVLPLTLASVRFLAAGHRARFVGLLAAGALAMWWLPPWFASSWPTSALADVQLWFETGVVVNKDGDHFPGTLRAAVTQWLPRIATLLATILAIGSVFWLAGWKLARMDLEPTSPNAGARSSTARSGASIAVFGALLSQACVAPGTASSPRFGARPTTLATVAATLDSTNTIQDGLFYAGSDAHWHYFVDTPGWRHVWYAVALAEVVMPTTLPATRSLDSWLHVEAAMRMWTGRTAIATGSN
jgi:hypothetical protein